MRKITYLVTFILLIPIFFIPEVFAGDTVTPKKEQKPLLWLGISLMCIGGVGLSNFISLYVIWGTVPSNQNLVFHFVAWSSLLSFCWGIWNIGGEL